MRDISPQETKAQEIGCIDWIFWIDIPTWNNALVFNDPSERISTCLRQYFPTVDSLTIESMVEFEKVFHENVIRKNFYDLLFCTYLFHDIPANTGQVALMYETLYSALTPNGNLVFGYVHGSPSFGTVIQKLMEGGTVPFGVQRHRVRGSKVRGKELVETTRTDHRFRLISTLFVYPTITNPWTISDSDLIFKNVHGWKRKTQRNGILLSMMSSRFGSPLARYWWPNRIVILSKRDEHHP